MERQLLSMTYIKEAVDNLKASINKLRKFILFLTYLTPFELLKENMI